MRKFKVLLKMAQISNISAQVQLKCCGEKFYEFFKNKMESFYQMFPENLQSYKIVEGSGFAHGSIIYRKYDFGYPVETIQRLHMDDTNKTIVFEFLEGDTFKDFEMLQVKGQVSDGGRNGMSSVKWSVEFVKANENVNPPHNFLQFGVKASKGLDAYLCNNLTT